MKDWDVVPNVHCYSCFDHVVPTSFGVCRWIQSWATLVTTVSAYPTSKSRLILDFIDYPDKAGLMWEANNGLPGAGTSCHLILHRHLHIIANTQKQLGQHAWHCCFLLHLLTSRQHSTSLPLDPVCFTL